MSEGNFERPKPIGDADYDNMFGTVVTPGTPPDPEAERRKAEAEHRKAVAEKELLERRAKREEREKRENREAHFVEQMATLTDEPANDEPDYEKILKALDELDVKDEKENKYIYNDLFLKYSRNAYTKQDSRDSLRKFSQERVKPDESEKKYKEAA